MPIRTRPSRNTRRAHGTSHRPTPPEARRRRPLTRRVALVAAVPLLALGLAACQPTKAQESVRAHINSSRQQHGVHALGDELIVRYKAQQWAEHLAATDPHRFDRPVEARRADPAPAAAGPGPRSRSTR